MCCSISAWDAQPIRRRHYLYVSQWVAPIGREHMTLTSSSAPCVCWVLLHLSRAELTLNIRDTLVMKATFALSLLSLLCREPRYFSLEQSLISASETALIKEGNECPSPSCPPTSSYAYTSNRFIFLGNTAPDTNNLPHQSYCRSWCSCSVDRNYKMTSTGYSLRGW